MNKPEAIETVQDIVDVANVRGSAYIYRGNGGIEKMQNILDCLKNSELVRHGHWIPAPFADDMFTTHYTCSECGRLTSVYHGIDIQQDKPYCNCGAKMDEK